MHLCFRCQQTTLLSCRFRAFWEAGSAGGSGRPSSRITSAHLMQRAWGRGTRWCSACWTQRPSTSSSFTSWWTTSWGHCAWPPALRSRRLHMMMSAAFSSTGWFILAHRNLEGYCSFQLSSFPWILNLTQYVVDKSITHPQICRTSSTGLILWN